MGNFDDDFYEWKEKPGRRRKGFLSHLIAGVLGGALVLASIPMLQNLGWMSNNTGLETVPNTEGVTFSPTGNTNNVPPAQTYQISVEGGAIQAVDKAEESVVGVINIQNLTDFWSRRTELVEAGTGSGVLFAKDGGKSYIVTNYHVVEGAVDLEVSLVNGERVPAEVVGVDWYTDLAVISIDARDGLVYAEFGDSSYLRVGEPAIAIGNPLGLEFSRTVTQGIISSTERSVPQDLNGDGQPEWELDVVQTDAAINPGNSGGALINIDGKVVGINSIKIMEAGIEGLGFAIPSNDVLPIIEDILAYGYVKRPYIGIDPKDLQLIDSYHRVNTLNLPDEVVGGIVIIDLPVTGPAYLAGLRELDVITQLDQTPIQNSAELRKYLYRNKKAGEQVQVTYYRDGKVNTTTIQLTQFPKDATSNPS